MDIMSMIAGALTPETVDTVAGTLGLEQGKTRTAIAMGVPALVSAIAKNAADRDGAKALGAALDKDHDGAALGQVQQIAEDPQAAKGEGILGHVLGEKRGQVEQGIGEKSGVSSAEVARIMAAVAPVVLGAIGKQKKEQGLDDDGVAAALAGEEAKPDFMTKLLDDARDGDVSQDLLKTGGDLLSSWLK